MKILISIILMAISTSAYSQVTAFGKTFKKGEVVKFTQNDKFKGKYVWKNGSEIFTLNLNKKIIKNSSDESFEIVSGTYDYTKNGKNIYSYAKNPMPSGNLSGNNVVNGELIIYFQDGMTGARAKGGIKFNTGGQLIWKIKRVNEAYVGKPKELSVPTDMVLEKISN